MKKSLLTAGCVILAVSVATPGLCLAGGVKGKLKTSKEFQEYFNQKQSTGTQKVDYYWEVANGVLPVMPPSLDMAESVSVALFTKDGKTPSGFLPQHPEVYGAQLNPSVVVAPPKVTLKFHNADPFVHELYSADMGKLFEPELQSSKQTRQVQFSNPGVYHVGCKTTPHLKGWVVITDGVVTSKNPDADGGFQFEDVAPGDYVIKVFFEGKVVASTEITVVDSDKEKDYAQVELELAVPEQGQPKGKAEEKKAGAETGGEAEKAAEKKESGDSKADDGKGK